MSTVSGFSAAGSAYSSTEHTGESRIETTVDLSQVASEDQVLIKDVCAVLVAIRPDINVESISVTILNQVYHVAAAFPSSTVAEIHKSDLDAITDVNPLRVAGTSVVYDGTRLSIKARVCGFSHPITCTDTQLVRVVKRKRWTLF
jgi:hypothetical protein